MRLSRTRSFVPHFLLPPLSHRPTPHPSFFTLLLPSLSLPQVTLVGFSPCAPRRNAGGQLQVLRGHQRLGIQGMSDGQTVPHSSPPALPPPPAPTGEERRSRAVADRAQATLPFCPSALCTMDDPYRLYATPITYLRRHTLPRSRASFWPGCLPRPSRDTWHGGDQKGRIP